MAPIGAKLQQNAFWTICDFGFFGAENFFADLFFGFFGSFSLFSSDFGVYGVFYLIHHRNFGPSEIQVKTAEGQIGCTQGTAKRHV